LAEPAFASKIEPSATTRRRCEEAIAVAEQHGWCAEPVISPALVNLAGTLIWTGEFDEADRWLHRAARALETDTGPSLRLLLHLGTGLLMSGRRRQREALPAKSVMLARLAASPKATRLPLSPRSTMP
jgi:LuxR family maltose regulon positive regulatory protein